MGAASSHECFPVTTAAATATAAVEEPPPVERASIKHVASTDNRKPTPDGVGEGHADGAPAPTSPPVLAAGPRPPVNNTLGLTAQEVADVRRLHGLLARDASTHCVRMHIKYFRRCPEHLERFCGRAAQAEPLHYAPAELTRDSEFTARALMHGLAQLQALRCSCTGDVNMMARQLASIARAHKGLGLTRDDCRKYRDVMLGYLEEALPQAMTPSTRQSWSTFLSTLCDGLVDSLDLQEQQSRCGPIHARKIALTSSWIEHELPKGWPLVVYYNGGRTTLGRRRLAAANSTCSACDQAACTCKRIEHVCCCQWDTIHKGKTWRNDSDTFPSLLEDNENESFAELEGERSQCASETFPVGMSASQFASD